MITKSILKFCKDYTRIENYDKAVNDPDETWLLHHRLETHFSDGIERPYNAHLSRAELIGLDMYYNRPPEELIFLTRSDHSILHMKSVETRQKQSEAMKVLHKLTEGTRRKSPEVKRKRHLSEEHKRKLAEAHKGKHHSSLTRMKISLSLKEHFRQKQLDEIREFTECFFS